MCGISGELRFDGQRPGRETMQAMLAKLERRGPDSKGSYFKDAPALGHRRLSIIDLSERSNQLRNSKESAGDFIAQIAEDCFVWEC